MSFKTKAKSFWNKFRRKASDAGESVKQKFEKNAADAEISAEEVAREEIYPEGKRRIAHDCAGVKDAISRDVKKPKNASCRNADTACGKSDVKPACKKNRSRPTNPGYQMIDPDDNSCDTSKS